MGALKLLVTLGALLLASPSDAQAVAHWRPYVDEASARFGVPIDWIERVMQAESRGRTHRNGRPIRSRAGAIGLMQLMSGTWADVRARLGLGHDPDAPRDNILAGTFYLRLMYDRFGYPGLFAAYNAGPGRYAAHLAGHRALPAETVGYLASVAPSSPASALATATSLSPPPLFMVRRGKTVGPHAAVSTPAPSIFVPLSQGH
jgi:soluble lytic murein transglycosylase-like protein